MRLIAAVEIVPGKTIVPPYQENGMVCGSLAVGVIKTVVLCVEILVAVYPVNAHVQCAVIQHSLLHLLHQGGTAG